MKDSNGNEFRIHFHKVIYKSGVTEWSATEESTGLKCIDNNKPTKKEPYERMLEIVPVLNHVLSRHTNYIEQMIIFKEKNNIK